MKPIPVGLVDLGESLHFRVERLARTLNSLQKTYFFENAGVVTATVLGEPDVEGSTGPSITLSGLFEEPHVPSR
jgi:hypothetical protein